MIVSSLIRAKLAVAVALLAACLDPAAPPADAYALIPPPEYRAAWQQVEDCSGLRGDFSRVRWFAVPGHRFLCSVGWCDGLWTPPHNIYISEEQALNSDNNDYFIARHEMLHDLLQVPGHPQAFCTCDLWRSGCDP